MTADVTRFAITREWMVAHWERLQALSEDLGWDYWGHEHFLKELPGKWDLSARAEIGGDPVGYRIASKKGAWVWLHHLVVRRDHRGTSVGKRLLDDLETAAGSDAQGVRLKVAKSNTHAATFYEKRGYRVVNAEGDYLLAEKLAPGRRRVVAIHQPNYFPWPGYFHKMLKSDHFVFLDDALTTNNSFINRNRIKQHGGELWLTVPCKQNLTNTINEIGFADPKWVNKHLKTIQQYYSKARYFKDYFPAIEEALKIPATKLAEVNIRLVKLVAGWLGINCVTHLSSDLRPEGTADDRLIHLVRMLDGQVYVSGKGGANYQSEEKFRAAGIDLVYHDFRPPVYPQLGGEFVPGLSVLDLLFNCGHTRATSSKAPRPMTPRRPSRPEHGPLGNPTNNDHATLLARHFRPWGLGKVGKHPSSRRTRPAERPVISTLGFGRYT